MLKDTYGISSVEIAQQLKECEMITKSKKVPKGHGKKKEVGSCIEILDAPLEDDEQEEYEERNLMTRESAGCKL